MYLRMEIKPHLSGTAFVTGYEIVQTRGLAVLGISLGNSYFSKNKIQGLMQYCATTFSQTRVLIPARIMIYTYLAQGYPKREAEIKARLKGNALRNSCKGIDQMVELNVRVLEWEREIAKHNAYLLEELKIETLYRNNAQFRSHIRQTTASVLESTVQSEVNIDDAVELGIYFLLKELAFLSASPKIFGVENVAYVYHKRWDIYERFVNGDFCEKRTDLGFVIVR